MTRLLENTFRAVNIAFANEIADAAREVGVEPTEVIPAAATKPCGFTPVYPSAAEGVLQVGDSYSELALLEGKARVCWTPHCVIANRARRSANRRVGLALFRP